MNRLRGLLDMVATLAIVAACGAITWTTLRRPPVPQPAHPGARPENTSVPVKPVSLDGASLQGNPHAKAVLVVYSDFQCPYCGTFARETLPEIQQKYVRTGKLLVAFRNFPLERIHQSAVPAAEAAACAGEQGKFWQMHDELFANQKDLTRDAFVRDAEQIGIDRTTFGECLSGRAEARIKLDEQQGQLLGISGTPTIFLGSLVDSSHVQFIKRLTGAQPFGQMDALIDTLVRKGTLEVEGH